MAKRSPAAYVVFGVAAALVLFAGYLVYQSRIAPEPVAPAKKSDFPLVFKDDAGRTITITTPPSRIVSMSPAITEILFALGLGDRIVGTDDNSDFPSSARNTSKVGTVDNPDVAALANAAPQVIISAEDLQARQVIAQHGQIIVLRVDTLDDVYRVTGRLAAITGRKHISGELLDSLKAREAAIRKKAAARPIARVYVELPAKGEKRDSLTEDSAPYFFDLLSRVRAESVFPGDKFYPQAPAELLDRLRPDVILILDPAVSASEASGRPGWAKLLRATGARVFTTEHIDPSLVLRPGPRGVDGLERLRELLHPIGKGMPE